MNGYALEISLIEWKCDCKKHEKGYCSKSSTQFRRTLQEVYKGNFGFEIKNEKQAIEKFKEQFIYHD